MEAVQGFQRVQRATQLDRFVSRLAAFEILPFETEVAILAGRIYGDLKRTGQPIGRADPMIAATAMSGGLAVVTGNVAHYARIAALGYHLAVEDWRAAQ